MVCKLSFSLTPHNERNNDHHYDHDFKMIVMFCCSCNSYKIVFAVAAAVAFTLKSQHKKSPFALKIMCKEHKKLKNL